MNKYTSIISNLAEAAQKSQINYKLAAAIIKGTKQITKPCINTDRSIYRGFHNFSLHAEANAILNLYGKDLSYIPNSKNFNVKNQKKCDLLVIRVNNNGELCNSRPCINCLKMMKDVKIKRVYYINNNKELVSEQVKDMISICTTSVSHEHYYLETKIKLTKTEYVETILKSEFPEKVKKNSLGLFIKNYLNDFDYKFVFEEKDGQKYISILNSNNIEIKKSSII